MALISHGLLQGYIIMLAKIIDAKKLELFFILFMMPVSVLAGGITLSSTRIIYPQDVKQTSITVRNTDDKSSFLVQSWVENKDGSKSHDFIVTPPLYASEAGNENILRLMFVGGKLPNDRESIYYFNTKAIPSIDKMQLENKNALMLAAVTRIKLFVRPSGLTLSKDDAPAKLRFLRNGDQLKIKNPTPYYITITNLKIDNKSMKGVMVEPKSEISLIIPHGIRNISYSTINDYGAITSPKQIILK